MNQLYTSKIVAVRKRLPLVRVWVSSGNPTMPLVCRWISSEVVAQGPALIVPINHGKAGLRLCA